MCSRDMNFKMPSFSEVQFREKRIQSLLMQIEFFSSACVFTLECVGTVTGQNGSGQNGTDKMVWTKWYTDKMVLGKMVRTKWYGQNVTILYFVNTLIQLNSIYI